MTAVLLQQTIIAVAAAGLLVFASRAARSGRLSFGTAVLWVSIAVVAIIGAALVPAADRLAGALGVIPAALLAGVASSALAGIVLTLSVRVTRLEHALQRALETLAGSQVNPPLPAPSPQEAGDALAIVPAYNEERSVRDVAEGLLHAGLAVLVVDDGSSDRTAAEARAAGASVLSLPSNLGVGGALRAGIQHALDVGYARVVQCDADGQHPPDQVVALLSSAGSSDAHLFVGSRFLATGSRREIPLARRAAMLLLSALASRAAGRRLTDPTSGLRVIREPLLSEVARHLPRHYLGDTFELAASAGRAGFVIEETPVTMQARLHGRSSASVASAVMLTLRAVLVVLLGAHLPFAPQGEPASD